MCKKCRNNPKNRNTRYCDDWWDDTPHGGYKQDRKRKREDSKRIDRQREKDDHTWDNYSGF